MCLCVRVVYCEQLCLHSHTHYECEARKLQSADYDKVEWQYLDLEFWSVDCGVRERFNFILCYMAAMARELCSSTFFSSLAVGKRL